MHPPQPAVAECLRLRSSAMIVPILYLGSLRPGRLSRRKWSKSMTVYRVTRSCGRPLTFGLTSRRYVAKGTPLLSSHFPDTRQASQNRRIVYLVVVISASGLRTRSSWWSGTNPLRKTQLSRRTVKPARSATNRLPQEVRSLLLALSSAYQDQRRITGQW